MESAITSRDTSLVRTFTGNVGKFVNVAVARNEALKGAIYDSQALHDFIGIDLSAESVPDVTTLLTFRHLSVLLHRKVRYRVLLRNRRTGLRCSAWPI